MEDKNADFAAGKRCQDEDEIFQDSAELFLDAVKRSKDCREQLLKSLQEQEERLNTFLLAVDSTTNDDEEAGTSRPEPVNPNPATSHTPAISVLPKSRLPVIRANEMEQDNNEQIRVGIGVAPFSPEPSPTPAEEQSNLEPSASSPEAAPAHVPSAFLETQRVEANRRKRIRGRLPFWFHRFIIMAVAALVALLELSYFLLYFVGWQIAVWGFFTGLRRKPPAPYLLLAFMVNMGLTEDQIVRSRRLIRTLTLLWTDFCIYVIATALSQTFFCSILHCGVVEHPNCSQ